MKFNNDKTGAVRALSLTMTALVLGVGLVAPAASQVGELPGGHEPLPLYCGKPLHYYGANVHVNVGFPTPFFGTAGNDLILGTINADTIYGMSGDDCIYGYRGNDRLFGDGPAGPLGPCSFGGNDVILGGVGNDYISGCRGNDRLYGEAGNDQIYGDGGQDVMWGNAGKDFMDGGADPGDIGFSSDMDVCTNPATEFRLVC